MLESLRKAFGRDQGPVASHGIATPGQLALWAGAQRWSFTYLGDPGRFELGGTVLDQPWRLESGAPTRDYIQEAELRVRAGLRISPEACLMVISRPLKEVLEDRLYSTLTDSLQTAVDERLPQEMRWLSIYEEITWPQLPPSFSKNYAVLGNRADRAQRWVNATVVSHLLQERMGVLPGQTPLVLLLGDARVTLRLQTRPRHLPDLEYAMALFLAAATVATHQLPPSDDSEPATLPPPG